MLRLNTGVVSVAKWWERLLLGRLGGWGLAACLLILPIDGKAQDDTAMPAAQSQSQSQSENQSQSLALLSLELVNRERQAHGLPALDLDPLAGRAAANHAADMLARGYYAHRSPEGDSVLDRIVAAGGSPWLKAAENIAECSICPEVPGPALVERLHRRWMESPGHRRNILAEGITQFGFGLAAGPPMRAYAVQAFAGPGTAPTGDGGAPRRLAPDAQLALALALLNQARQEESRAALSVDQALLEASRGLLEAFDDDPEMPLGSLSAQALFDGLAQADQDRWEQLEILVLSCGGCGAVATEGDIKRFLESWLEKGGSRERLLARAASHYGFALWSSGTGRKIALAVVGKGR